ncbi:hypothetical protein BS78_10G134800 [Paspalum vaginatum]|nr:hypothetical protein BS78_10G134800 [Paspalum vaginatum]
MKQPPVGASADRGTDIFLPQHNVSMGVARRIIKGEKGLPKYQISFNNKNRTFFGMNFLCMANMELSRD